MYRVVLIVLFLLIALPMQTQAPPWIRVLKERTPNWECGAVYDGPGVVKLRVFAYNGSGLTATRFTAPVPECLEGGVWLSDTPVFSVTMGNSQTGVAISFGSCMYSGWIHVLTINVYVDSLAQSCCPYRFLPHPDATTGGPEVVDCNDHILTASDVASFVSPGGSPATPYVEKPQPADGATEQPVDTKLSWSVYLCSCALGVYWDDVYFGTTPNPPRVAEQTGPPYDPGPLEPQTTYYWKVIAYDWDGGGGTVSPVWTFTTGVALPVERSTWGRIKGLYLE